MFYWNRGFYYNKLFESLRNIGKIREQPLKLFQTFLSYRTQHVKIGKSI